MDEIITKYLPEVWNWLTSIQQWNTPEGWLARLAVWLLAIYFLLKIAKYFLNELLEIQDKWKKLGLPVTFSTEKKAKIRQRQQFCKVLRSDLATIAKAENWNDQFFTDLEAEVEAEGYYFTSAFNRLIRKKSYGLRREPSLVKSIDRSAEQFLLLVGAPGSGKSVALRHLAHQLAERAIKSSSETEKIPLYINLKELPSVTEEQLTPDFIKQFVLDNIRRGDADTVDYLRENWDEYWRKGVWFFLFDSFDEIPAVLHAPTGSKVVQLHSEAIRKFLAGMSSCRSVLASREFKGPETLPWQKFCILPLSSQRKEELIENSFLKPPQKEIVRRHLAINESTIHSNPLFLTLLCRYVKEVNAAPINDHDLLNRHIQRLAYRDPEHTQKRYSLSPEELLQGATTLAVLFAENKDLSLAPTRDEIAAALQDLEKSIAHLDNLLAALVDVKIARSDVQEARRGDRRFTFSHRRYQETLFVYYLAEHSDVIQPRELLTNLRWREYTVTLLQTQPIEKTEIILNEAAKLLNEYSQAQNPVPILPEFGGHLSYYEWNENAEVSLLHLLQEGLCRRIKEIPADLSQKIALLLEPRWNNGDEYDREMVIETGGLLPQQTLIKYLTYAIEHGSGKMMEIGFRKTIFLTDIPEQLAEWLTDRLSEEVVSAKSSADILKLEALSLSLPDSVGATFVFSHSKKINPSYFKDNLIEEIVELPFSIIINSIIIIIILIYILQYLTFSIDTLLFLILAVYFTGCFTCLLLYVFRKFNKKITLTSLIPLNYSWMLICTLLITMIFFFLLIHYPQLLNKLFNDTLEFLYNIHDLIDDSTPENLKGKQLSEVFNREDAARVKIFFALSVIFMLIGIITIILDAIIKIIIFLFKSYMYLSCSFVKKININDTKEYQINKLVWMFKFDKNLSLFNREHTRSLLRLLRSQPQPDPQHPVFSKPLFRKKWKKRSVDRLTELLLKKLRD